MKKGTFIARVEFYILDHVAMVSDGLTWSIYINGQKEELTIVKGINNGKWINGLYGIDNFVKFNIMNYQSLI